MLVKFLVLCTHDFLVACYATLHPALSVGRSVGWSVGRLVGWSVGRLVGRSVVIELRMMKMHRILEISQIIASFHKVDAILHHS